MNCAPIIAMAFACLVSTGFAQIDGPRDYSDGARGFVTLPQGDRSFADRVVHVTPGSGRITDSAKSADAALGPPNYSGNVDDGSFLTLGCNGSVVLQFVDNALVDVPGPDLYVFEVGPKVEGTALAVSETGETWVELGGIEGGRAEVDIAATVSEGTSFRFVRLTDDGIDCSTRFAGADIDAVAAIGSAMRFTLDGEVLFDHDSTTLRPEALATLDSLAMDIADYGLTRIQVVGHTDRTGSEAYNLDLSRQRAVAVRDYLDMIEVLKGVSIRSEGRGEADPIATNDTEEGRQENRRVEIIGR